MTVPGKDEPDAWSVVGVMMDPLDVGVIVVAVDAAAVAAGDGWATVVGMVSVDELGGGALFRPCAARGCH